MVSRHQVGLAKTGTPRRAPLKEVAQTARTDLDVPPPTSR